MCLEKAMIGSIKSQRGVEDKSTMVRCEDPCGRRPFCLATSDRGAGAARKATVAGRGCAATDAEINLMEEDAGNLLPFHRVWAHDRVDPCQADMGRRALFRKGNARQRMTFTHVSCHPITHETEKSDLRLGLPS